MDKPTKASTKRACKREPSMRRLCSTTSLTKLRTTKKTNKPSRMMLMLISKKKTTLPPSEYSGVTSGNCTSKKIRAATISAVTSMTMPSRLRRLFSSSLRLCATAAGFTASIGARWRAGRTTKNSTRERKYRADDHQHDADQDQRLTQTSHGPSPHLLQF